MQKTLRLSLKKKWFEMTKTGIKIEEYREINKYWVQRLMQPLFNRNDWKRENEIIEH